MKDKNKKIFHSIAKFIVNKRHLIAFTFLIATIFSIFSMNWVDVENDVVNYLDEKGKTRQGIMIMEDEFINFGMAEVMISNISYNHAWEIGEEFKEVKGVSTVMFENTEDHYKNSSALFIVLFEGEENSDLCLEAMEEIREIVEPFDSSISTTIGFDMAVQLEKDMLIIGILAAIVVVLVLLFSSKSYAEIPVLLITFGVAALLNMGTNFLLGRISFISHSVAVVLQLALAIDYAIILAHRYTEERENLSAKNAAIEALSKAIPEISSSSLTTVGGLAALGFMNFAIGLDLAVVMIKAILISMLSVFVLMPGLLVMFSKWIDKTHHRSFVPSVSAIGRFAIKTRYIMPPIFLILLIGSFILSNKLPFRFSLDEIRPFRLSQEQKEADRIQENFGHNNVIAVIVPSGDFEIEKKLLNRLSSMEEVDMAVGLSNTEAMGGYMLTENLSPRQFSELVDIDHELAQVLFSAYALNNEQYGKVVSGVSNYGVPLIDMIEFLYGQIQQGFVSLDEELISELEGYYGQLKNARLQMEGQHYSRLILYTNLAVETKETFDFVDRVYKEAGKYYDHDSIFLMGESTNAQELSSTFDRDNLIISILSVLFVIVILIITFKSFGLGILLISVIQASIWINFSFPYIRNQELYFLGFLIVSSVQMGANIDYAIVMTSRYFANKIVMDKREAVIQAMNQAFPTIITSGTILAVAGYLIGFISTDGATSILGTYIGQGTLISLVLVLFVLPQLLYLGDILIERTSFALTIPMPEVESKEKLQVTGRVQGYIRGEIDAVIDGSLRGEIRPRRGNGQEEGDKSYEEI